MRLCASAIVAPGCDKKTEAGGAPRLIHTIRGVGYALRET